ncbi:sigma 54-interacting transcriptional regulator [Polyangium sorediatum]|uniref:Sigma 54-interacting transcriptional regulator n=1 Tax=Polyangium sorediatum TaxID=889274 RepID=A0ABT6NMQ8_9BACT|nr:sigma 54-interacting transcriptional regulator [Polyangium sorediatum]MDI1429606.1 sigma 54-interacting transcriptional regulator [Polyangium sorediatum]
MKTETLDDALEFAPDTMGTTHPGLLVVHSGEQPKHHVLACGEGEHTLEVGRDELAAAGILDGRVSRRHVRIELDDARWTVRDLGSRNGTFVDGRRVQSARSLSAPVVRIGHTVMLPVGDRRPYEARGLVVRDGVVMGSSLLMLRDRIALIALSGASVLILGETGAGKELCAEAFHTASGQSLSRPFVAVNCATIQKELAEGILFGARRGAYTGAVTDTLGLVQAANGGTLFLDEVAELDLGVQAKLLRVLETKRVMPLGGVTPIEVNVRVCAATHKDLRVEVTEGRFRGDLYFRIGRPEVRLPALRERREEIPWLIERALASSTTTRAKVTAGAEFVEACMLRPWPGNVRELLAESKIAALSAMAAHHGSILATDLDEEAGRALASADESEVDARPEAPAPEPEAIEAALRAEHGNVARAAARLGVTRGRVRRYVERQGIDVRTLR